MTKEQEMVREFMRMCGQTVNQAPTLNVPGTDVLLRRRLIKEEFKEFRDADNLGDLADALGDLLYVVLGTAVTYGIDLEPVFAEIHRSNMSKVWPDGTVRKDQGGKVIKPPRYCLPDIGRVLAMQFEFSASSDLEAARQGVASIG